MYISGKMRPAETIPGRVGIMMEGVNSSMIYLTYCKSFYKCHNVSPLQQYKNYFYEKSKIKWLRNFPNFTNSPTQYSMKLNKAQEG
jgi:hypothetical protein